MRWYHIRAKAGYAGLGVYILTPVSYDRIMAEYPHDPDLSGIDEGKLRVLREQFQSGAITGEGSSGLTAKEQAVLQGWAGHALHSEWRQNAYEQVAPEYTLETELAVGALFGRTGWSWPMPERQPSRTYYERIMWPCSPAGPPQGDQVTQTLSHYSYMRTFMSDPYAKDMRLLCGIDPTQASTPAIYMQAGQTQYRLEDVRIRREGYKTERVINLHETPNRVGFLKMLSRDAINAYRETFGLPAVPDDVRGTRFQLVTSSRSTLLSVRAQRYEEVKGVLTVLDEAFYMLDEHTVCRTDVSSPEQDVTCDAYLELLAQARERTAFNTSPDTKLERVMVE